jgi:hypothetical protein
MPGNNNIGSLLWVHTETEAQQPEGAETRLEQVRSDVLQAIGRATSASGGELEHLLAVAAAGGSCDSKGAEQQ